VGIVEDLVFEDKGIEVFLSISTMEDFADVEKDYHQAT
jgi:hypothetical protein